MGDELTQVATRPEQIKFYFHFSKQPIDFAVDIKTCCIKDTHTHTHTLKKKAQHEETVVHQVCLTGGISDELPDELLRLYTWLYNGGKLIRGGRGG